MFGPVALIMLILATPLLLAIVLVYMARMPKIMPETGVSASYWGSYEGQSRAPNLRAFGSIKLYDLTENPNAPSINQQHAVSWHP